MESPSKRETGTDTGRKPGAGNPSFIHTHIGVKQPNGHSHYCTCPKCLGQEPEPVMEDQ